MKIFWFENALKDIWRKMTCKRIVWEVLKNSVEKILVNWGKEKNSLRDSIPPPDCGPRPQRSAWRQQASKPAEFWPEWSGVAKIGTRKCTSEHQESTQKLHYLANPEVGSICHEGPRRRGFSNAEFEWSATVTLHQRTVMRLPRRARAAAAAAHATVTRETNEWAMPNVQRLHISAWAT